MSSCASDEACRRDRRRDADDPAATDVPALKPTLQAAHRLAEALVAMAQKALDPGADEDKAAVVATPAAVSRGLQGESGDAEQPQPCVVRPRLQERYVRRSNERLWRSDMARSTWIQPPHPTPHESTIQAAIDNGIGDQGWWWAACARHGGARARARASAQASTISRRR